MLFSTLPVFWLAGAEHRPLQTEKKQKQPEDKTRKDISSALFGRERLLGKLNQHGELS